MKPPGHAFDEHAVIGRASGRCQGGVVVLWPHVCDRKWLRGKVECVAHHPMPPPKGCPLSRAALLKDCGVGQRDRQRHRYSGNLPHNHAYGFQPTEMRVHHKNAAVKWKWTGEFCNGVPLQFGKCCQRVQIWFRLVKVSLNLTTTTSQIRCKKWCVRQTLFSHAHPFS